MKLYNLTLQRPGGITHVIHGNFSGPKQQEIIVSRGCVLEVLKPDPSTGKIHTLLTCNVFGIIRALHPIRLTGSNRGTSKKFMFNFHKKLFFCI
jgi:splicing factor 3B subunit 3